MNWKNKNKERAIAIIAISLIIFLTTIQPVLLKSNEGDLSSIRNHMLKAQGKCEEANEKGWSEEACESYRPLLGIITAPFSGSIITFTIIMFIIIGVITPLILFWITDKWITVLFYFTLTNYFYTTMDGIYAQALAMAIALFLLKSKSVKIDILILALLALTHGTGFALGAIFFVAKHLPKAFLICTGVFGSNTPKIVEEQIKSDPIYAGSTMNLANLIHVFTKVFPFPVLLIAFWQNLKDKDYHLIIILIASIAAGLTLQTRAFLVIPLIGIIGFTSFYNSQKDKGKFLIIVASLIWGLFNFISYINVKMCLGVI